MSSILPLQRSEPGVTESSPGLLLSLLAGWLLFAGFLVPELKRAGLPLRLSPAASLAGGVCALVCGKAYFLLFNTFLFSQEGFSVLFRPDPLEFSFVGACAGFCLGIYLVGRFLSPGRDAASLLDCAALPAGLLFACARFGQIFFGDLGLAEFSSLGLPDLESGHFLARFPFAVEDSFGVWYLALCFWEAILILLLLGLFFLLRRRHCAAFSSRPGLFFESLAYVLCALPFFLELTRLNSPDFYYVHVEQALCALIMLLLLIRLLRRPVQPPVSGFRRFCPLLIFVLLLVLNGLMQYFMDKPWKLEGVLPQGMFLFFNENLFWISFFTFLLTTFFLVVLYFFRLYKILRDSR